MFEVMSTGYYSITLQRLFKFRSVEADRSNSVASLEMENTTFPKDPILVSLLAATQRVADPEPMINDVMGFSKGYPDLLGDVLATRARLRQQLPEAALETNQLLKEEFPYIFLFCQSGYEWLVGFFAIRALGGAVMPLAQGILAEEAQYLQEQTESRCILFGKGCQAKVDKILQAIVSADKSSSFTSVSISTDAEPQAAACMTINESQVLSPGGPGVVFLTSGTSGPPKVAVLPRQCLVAEQLAPPGGAGINCRQGHWIGGADGMLEPILTGQSLHCIGQQATAAEVLQAFVDHRITHALFGPLLLTRMRDLIVGPTGVLSDQARRKYCTLFRGLLSIRGGGANIEPAVRQFWVNLTGLPYENFYASTELGMRACSSLSGEDGCIGVPGEAVKIKLTSEPVGEMRLRSRTMFTHYIGDKKATQAAFDSEGFLKTEDLAKYHNGQYFLLGRENLDYVRGGHLHFPAAEVQRALLALPGILEACVVGVSVRARAQLCAAVIRVRSNGGGGLASAGMSLRALRQLLHDAGSLPIYMFPVLLRVLGDQESLPLTHSGKVAKGAALTVFFGGRDVLSMSSLPMNVEVWGHLPSSDELGAPEGDGAVKAWDWGGLQIT